ncbi:MAG: (Fe-S)-binding protein [Blastocatellia bacterium]
MNTSTSLHTALHAETEKILGCIHCGLCLPACPTYGQNGNENDSPRGRIYLMRAVAEGRLDAASPTFSRHIDLCLGCRACETACPAGVNYGHLLETARETILEQKIQHGSTLQKTMLKLALRHIFPYPGRLKIAFALSRWMRGNALVRFAYRKGIVRWISPKADFALSLLMTTAAGFSAASGDGPPGNINTQSVSVFTGCVMEGLFKPANDATKRVLAVNGCANVTVESQVCCGALHAHSGDLETARDLARRNIDAFDAFLNLRAGATIIINAAGCGALLKEYGELLKGDSNYAERARRFSGRVRDATEFLAASEIKRGGEISERVTYDAPCHLYHAQRVTTAQQKLFDAIPGLQYAPLEGMQDCCGGAGIYNLSEPERSEGLLSEKIEKVKATGAATLVTANPGCHMQLGAGARMFGAEVRVAHIVELLDESYRRAGFYQ